MKWKNLKEKGEKMEIKVYKTNSSLGFNQYAYLIKLIDYANNNDIILNDNEECYLVVDRYNIHDDNYDIGTVVILSPYELEVDNDFNLDESMLAKNSPFLWKHFILSSEFEFNIIDEKTLPITLGMIKATCGWSKFCDVTDSNHYMLNEFSVSDNEIFHVKYSHAKELGLIK